MEDVGKEVKVNKKFNEKYSPFVASKNLVRKNGTRGITLIALVITIIVLLILAGVSIATLTGDNGILNQADRARTETNRESVRERVGVEVLGSYDNEGKLNKDDLKNNLTNNLEIDGDITENGEGDNREFSFELEGHKVEIDKKGNVKVDGIGKGEKPLQLVEPGETAQLTQKDNYEDGNGDKATIPEGFKVSEEPDEQSVDTGLVVEAPDESKSEFVWVPVENAIAKDENDGNTNKAMAVKQSDGSYRGLLYNFTDTSSSVISGCTTTNFTSNSGVREPAVLNGTSGSIKIDDSEKGITLEILQLEYKAMIESVDMYGGFYVGRYETSLTSDNNNVASVKNADPMSAETTKGNMWYGMYDKQKNYAKNVNGKDISTIVGSSMIWGSQYDAMLNWILTGDDKSKVTEEVEEHDLTTTGLISGDVMNNIYDLGNNLYEWTLEAYYSDTRVGRGGYYYSTHSPSHRGNNYPTAPGGNYGSRLTLYIK